MHKILRYKVKKALLVTDGWVGTISSNHVEGLKKGKVTLHGAIISGGDPSFLAPVGGRAWQLPHFND